MSGLRPFVVIAVVGWLGLAADVSEAALAKKAGGSGFSGTLSKNKAIRKQQLIADPDEPVAGSTSVQYDPSVVSLSGFEFGPGYAGTAFVQVMDPSSERTSLVELNTFLTSRFGTETGYVQVQYSIPVTAMASPAAALAATGQITPPDTYQIIDEAGPAGIDTHAFFFDYLAGVSDETVARYTIFAAKAGQFGDNEADFLSGLDENGDPYTLSADQIAPATVRGSLVNGVPLPAAALTGGLMLAGLFARNRLARRAA